MECGLRVASYGLRVASYGVRVEGCGLRVASSGLREKGQRAWFDEKEGKKVGSWEAQKVE
jgi:hypothetical protein